MVQRGHQRLGPGCRLHLAVQQRSQEKAEPVLPAIKRDHCPFKVMSVAMLELRVREPDDFA